LFFAIRDSNPRIARMKRICRTDHGLIFHAASVTVEFVPNFGQ